MHTAGHDRAAGRSEPVRTILDAIGGTPLIEIEGIWAKLEFLNPSRVDQGEDRPLDGGVRGTGGAAPAGRHHRRGQQRQHRQALSMVAAVKGYRMLVVMLVG